IATTGYGNGRLEHPCGPHGPVAVVQDLHRDLDESGIAAGTDPDIESAYFRNDLVVYRYSLPGKPDPTEATGTLERFGKTRLNDLRQPVGPLRAREILQGCGRSPDDDILAVQWLERG